MFNQNIADISQFESLQANQHAQSGMSQMAVFNDLATVKDLAAKYKAVVDKYLQHSPKAKAVYDELQNAKKQGEIKANDPVLKKFEDMFKVDTDIKREIAAVSAQLKKEAAKERKEVNKSVEKDEPGARDRMAKTNAVFDEIQKTQRTLQEQARKFDMIFDANANVRDYINVTK